MKIAFCSSEVFPFAKSGGLADVSGTLPFALSKKGHQVKVFMPLYRGVTPREMNQDFGITKAGEVEIIFIRNDDYFLRSNFYGDSSGDYPDNLERFVFFNKKIAVVLKKMNFSPDIIHCNDWQTAPLVIYLKTKYKADKFFENTKSVLTIHNLAYQGIFQEEKFPFLDIASNYFSISYLEFYGKINLLKGGIIFADIVNTVSPEYARQVQSVEYGCGLDGVLRQKGRKFAGILNAIDYKVWDPKRDKLIYKNYSVSSLEGKRVNKSRLQKELGFSQKRNVFLLGVVSRLAEQKGIDILSKALEDIVKKYQLVILGVGDERYHRIFKNKQKKHKHRFAVNLGFDDSLAHKIYAGCDAFLMPSRFEPCGLSQMISYKYATVPIVHHTGGLVDTVVDYGRKGGGFVFKEYNDKALINAVDRAKDIFDDNKEWAGLLKKIIKYNFSWSKSTQEYIRIYNKCRLLP